ncbi:uncharacterized protein LOC124508398 [Lynx rufus]|uniref:uncharacterized protein LOC124508398 n=1 Tax=Lynx rufus TaxID=61384 RepID=UPI001F126E73|nr:uncharacterized protein LOC124508398 [Lynx rufus]
MTSSIFFSTREATWHQALALWAELGSGSVSEATWAEGLSPKQPALTTPAMFLSALLPWLLGCYPNSATGHGETTSGTHSQLGGFLHPFIWCPLGWEGLWDLLGGVGYRSSLLHPSSEVCPRGWDCPPRRGDLNQPVPALPSSRARPGLFFQLASRPKVPVMSGWPMSYPTVSLAPGEESGSSPGLETGYLWVGGHIWQVPVQPAMARAGTMSEAPGLPARAPMLLSTSVHIIYAPLLMNPGSVCVHQLSWEVPLTVRRIVPSELLTKKGEAWFGDGWERGCGTMSLSSSLLSFLFPWPSKKAVFSMSPTLPQAHNTAPGLSFPRMSPPPPCGTDSFVLPWDPCEMWLSLLSSTKRAN